MARINKSRNPSKPIATQRRDTTSTAGPYKAFGPLVRDKIIISIDYGTTFTSVAYKRLLGGKPERHSSLKARLDNVELVTTWPGSSGENSTVPTKVVYAAASKDIDRRIWVGHRIEEAEDQGDIPVGHKEIVLAKLLLHDAKETEEETRGLKETAKSMGKEDYEFIAIYLAFLRQHLFGKDGNSGYFGKVHTGWLKNADVEFIFGVPPAWTMPEQQKMMLAARKAGFTNVSLGSEAESLLAVFLAGNESSLDVGDAIVCCDAGGGTVDLATVIVRSLDPLVVDEACVSEGVLCGGIYVDRNARNMFRRKLRRENLPDFEIVLDRLVKEFDLKFKKRFEGPQGARFEVPGLKEDLTRGFCSNRLLITDAELRELVFDPIVEQIEAQILWQISKSQETTPDIRITTIALGGGLGGSDYIYACLQRAVNGVKTVDNVDIQRLANPGGANVARGLILLASQQGLVKQRRCRRHYGLYTVLSYDKKVHGGSEVTQPEYDDLYGSEPIIRTVDWLLCKGQPINDNFEVRRPGRSIGVLPEAQQIEELFFIFDGELPSDLADKKYTLLHEIPRQHTKEVRLTLDISQISKHDHFVEKFAPDGDQWFEVKFDFVLRHLENDIISCTIVVKSKTGEKLTIPHKPFLLDEALKASDADDTETKCLGSLVSRWTKGPHVTESRYGKKPLFGNGALFPGLSRRRRVEDHVYMKDLEARKFGVEDEEGEEDFEEVEQEDEDWTVI